MEDLARLKEKILGYRLDGSNLGSLGYIRVLLQICGPAGNGKSSLINSFKYALYNEKFSILAPVAPAMESQGGFTKVRLPYKLTEVITLVDNRGFGKSDNFEKEEVYAQLANLQPLNIEVTWNWSYEDRMKTAISAEVNTNDLLVPIYVHSVEKKMNEDEDEKEEMKEFFNTIKKLTGFSPIVVLTKKSKGDAKKMREQFEGMDAETIFDVENYINDDYIKTLEKDTSFLSILAAVLDRVDFVSNSVVPNLESPDQEHRKRVQMLLKMAHDNDIQRRETERLKNSPPPPPKKGCVLL